MGLDPETAKTARLPEILPNIELRLINFPYLQCPTTAASAEVVIDGGQLETNRNWVQDGLGLCDDSEPTRDKYHRAWVRGQYHWSKVNQHAALMFRYYSAVRHG